MDSSILTKRELYIKSIFLPENKNTKKEYLSEEKVNEIVKAISNMGDRYGFIGDKENLNSEKSSKRRHKYDVWIAKEIKKTPDLIDQFNKIRFIIDWAIETKCNIFFYSFEEAFSEQEKWHRKLFEKYNIEELKIPELDPERVLYRCSDKNHFIYLLTADDLEYEGIHMSNCVGGDNYKSEINNGRSIIISLRDENNLPHVTTQIQIKNSMIVQQYGKSGKAPISEYKKMMIEFVLFATNYDKFKNSEIMHLLNLNQTL